MQFLTNETINGYYSSRIYCERSFWNINDGRGHKHRMYQHLNSIHIVLITMIMLNISRHNRQKYDKKFISFLIFLTGGRINTKFISTWRICQQGPYHSRGENNGVGGWSQGGYDKFAGILSVATDICIFEIFINMLRNWLSLWLVRVSPFLSII